MKPPSKAEVINDINGELVNLYRVIQHHLEAFIQQFKWALVSRQMFEWLQITPEVTLTDIQRAARFYYLQKQAFGGKVDGQTFGTATTSPPRFNLLRIEEDLSQAHMRLSRTCIEHMDWTKCIQRYDRPHTLFYCDPPYWQTEGYGVDFGFENYVMMAELARSMAGKMLISVNDIPEMRAVFAGLHMESVSIHYSLQGAGRSPSKQHELVIRNW
ncbi:restriction endonuclease subunit M [Serratia marcescens]|nr:restriction endonuclease subunit M [Serratia marcescens]